MTFEGAVIQEQGVTFAVVSVQHSLLQAPGRTREFIDNFSPLFPGLPIVLMAQNSSGAPSYHGRKEIAKFLAAIPTSAIPWQKFTLR
jgi:hypothetical protein